MSWRRNLYLSSWPSSWGLQNLFPFTSQLHGVVCYLSLWSLDTNYETMTELGAWVRAISGCLSLTFSCVPAHLPHRALEPFNKLTFLALIAQSPFEPQRVLEEQLKTGHRNPTWLPVWDTRSFLWGFSAGEHWSFLQHVGPWKGWRYS